MKFSTLFFSLLLPAQAFALSLSFIGPCDENPVFKTQTDLEKETNAGQITVDLLEKNNIEFVGSELGLNSAFGTPLGEEAYEIISGSEMYAYGWCYSVNGFEPALYPDKVSVIQGDEILWWFGYAHYKEGEWISQCEPSYKRKPQFLCSKK